MGCVTAKADGMRHSQVLLRDLLCLLICLFCAVRRLGLLFVGCVLRNVPVVVGLHLLVEDLGLAGAGLGNRIAIQESQDCVANFVELCFHFAAILLREFSVLFVPLGFLLLLHTGDDAPSCAAAAHGILVGHRQEVALFDGKLVSAFANCLHVLSHLIIALGLLGKLCKVDCLRTVHPRFSRKLAQGSFARGQARSI